MDNNMLDIINIAQLEILGVNKQFIYYCLFIMSILIVSVILYPIILILIKHRYIYVFIYIGSSLAFMLLVILFPEIIAKGIEIKRMVQLISLYGFCITCFLFALHVKKRNRHVTK